MFALVKYKCDNEIEGVPVQSIRFVSKENGVKSFAPFEPKHVHDFTVTKKYKYVVHKDHEDGLVRKWYAMIGRLGASMDEVLDSSKEHILWPYRKSCITAEVMARPASGTKEGVISLTSDLKEMVPSDISSHEDRESLIKRVKAVEGALLQAQELLEQLTIAVSKIFPDFRQIAVESIEKMYKSFSDRFEDVYGTIFKRMEETEALVNTLHDQVEKNSNMVHVLEWVNNCMSYDINMSNATMDAADVTSGNNLKGKEEKTSDQQESIGETSKECSESFDKPNQDLNMKCDDHVEVMAEEHLENKPKLVKGNCESDDDFFNDKE